MSSHTTELADPEVRTLRLQIETVRMPHSTQIAKLRKGLEDFYYAILLTTEKRYVGRGETWRSWVSMGFSLGLLDPPEGVADEDRIKTSICSDGKRLVLSTAGGDQTIQTVVTDLLCHIEELRPNIRGDDSQRADLLAADPKIDRTLLRPVALAVEACQLPPAATQLLLNSLRRGLVALTHPEILSNLVEV
jgi:hypothetical protein